MPDTLDLSKVIKDQPMHGSARVSIEQDVATDLQHPNIISTLAYFRLEAPVRTLEVSTNAELADCYWLRSMYVA